ncbi:MAG: hypothetical protein A3G39_04005 [Deltaproteobacteria bacterium RIFCSPLOWO2_12_FULL_43_16]|nr:MAG: hypothetical protein A3G39_04005 [Deltaproteobacteria bacterium RIFCSPLOWO2_12_FULL_43_16]
MDKIGFLRGLSTSKYFSLLKNSELKLYIMLLVNSTDTDVPERIALEQIERANGKSLDSTELKSMMNSLERYGLAILDDIIERTGGKGGEMIFKLQRPVSI